MKDDVITYVHSCTNCQMNKSEHTHTLGLLQPLPVHATPWTSISIDFVIGLPRSEGKDVIMVVVDRFTKSAHFIPLSHLYTVVDVAHKFFQTIYTLHGLPTSIITDRDPIFTSKFWQELLKLFGIQLNMSSAYYPQTDGQTERVNQCLEHYLRSMLLDHPKKWTKWLPLAQWWYNSTFHHSLCTSPFQTLFGYSLPQLPLGHPPRSRIESINTFLHDRHQGLFGNAWDSKK
jgi:transposase InsO family protein